MCPSHQLLRWSAKIYIKWLLAQVERDSPFTPNPDRCFLVGAHEWECHSSTLLLALKLLNAKAFPQAISCPRPPQSSVCPVFKKTQQPCTTLTSPWQKTGFITPSLGPWFCWAGRTQGALSSHNPSLDMQREILEGHRARLSKGRPIRHHTKSLCFELGQSGFKTWLGHSPAGTTSSFCLSVYPPPTTTTPLRGSVTLFLPLLLSFAVGIITALTLYICM